MRKPAVYWLRQAFQTALLVLLVSLAVDWWRKPAEPQRFASLPLATLNGGQTSLAALSRGRTAVVYFLGKLVRHLQTHLSRRTAPARGGRARIGCGAAIGRRGGSGRLYAGARFVVRHGKRPAGGNIAAMAGGGYTDGGVGEKRQNGAQHHRHQQLLGFARARLAGGQGVLKRMRGFQTAGFVPSYPDSTQMSPVFPATKRYSGQARV